MICFKCKGEEFVTQTAGVRQEFRDEQLDVTTPVCVCSACGWQTLGPGQTDELRKRTADAYRQKHGLLTSGEIVARRTRLGMNQHDFAAFLRVGEASVKRWETWQVQDASSDELIRIKTDFLAQNEQQALLFLQQYLVTSHRLAKVRLQDAFLNSFYFNQVLNYLQPDVFGPKNEFSLLKCRQSTPGGYAGRKSFTDEPDSEHDANSDLAAAA